MLRCALLGATKLAGRAGQASGRAFDGVVRAQAAASSAPALASEPAQKSFVRGFAAEPALAPSSSEGAVTQARRSARLVTSACQLRPHWHRSVPVPLKVIDDVFTASPGIAGFRSGYSIGSDSTAL